MHDDNSWVLRLARRGAGGSKFEGANDIQFIRRTPSENKRGLILCGELGKNGFKIRPGTHRQGFKKSRSAVADKGIFRHLPGKRANSADFSPIERLWIRLKAFGLKFWKLPQIKQEDFFDQRLTSLSHLLDAWFCQARSDEENALGLMSHLQQMSARLA